MKSFAANMQEKRLADQSLGEFIFLNQTRYDLNDNVTILGCTLWSNVPSSASHEVSLRLNDFRKIKSWTTETHNAAHIADAEWLDRECAKLRNEQPERRIIILTHHAPAIQGTSAPQYQGGSVNTAFATDMSLRSCWGNPLSVWAFGHTHFNCDFVKDNVRIVSNQRGYEGIEASQSRFSDDFVLNL